MTFRDLFLTPWGWAAAAWSAAGLQGLVLPREERRGAEGLLEERFGAVGEQRRWPELREQVCGYFRGTLQVLDLPLDVPARGPFARRVTEAVRSIPYGRKATYGEVAAQAGSPGAARAVGRVMAVNPVPLFVPCHRVVAGNGPGGFSAGGREMKVRLLAHESRRAATERAERGRRKR